MGRANDPFDDEIVSRIAADAALRREGEGTPGVATTE
jgi:hypothetical protein